MRPFLDRTLSTAGLLILAGCAGAPPQAPQPAATAAAPPPAAALPAQAVEAAVAPAPEPAEVFPVRGEGPPLPPPSTVLTRIAVGSCSEENQPIPILAAVAAAKPDLFLYLGDNVYGSVPADDPAFRDPALPRLRQAYGDLNLNAHFSAFNMSTPIVATWDDHDYAVKDGGADFLHREMSERIFETYWGSAALGGDHPGVYGARVFGPAGKRVQVIMLDTRFFRSSLTLSQPNDAGRRSFLPRSDSAATMLGEVQWRWLETELRKPAEVRVLVSSVQVLSDNHPYEGWLTLPSERKRLYGVIRASGAKGLVMLSGDRHVAGIYRQAGAAPYTLNEMTTSSLNVPVTTDDSEWSPAQVGRIYTPVNFGLVEIDWTGRKVALSVRDLTGAPQRSLTVPFSEIGI